MSIEIYNFFLSWRVEGGSYISFFLLLCFDVIHLYVCLVATLCGTCLQEWSHAKLNGIHWYKTSSCLCSFSQMFLLVVETSSQVTKNVYFYRQLLCNKQLSLGQNIRKGNHVIIFIYLKESFGERIYMYILWKTV